MMRGAPINGVLAAFLLIAISILAAHGGSPSAAAEADAMEPHYLLFQIFTAPAPQYDTNLAKATIAEILSRLGNLRGDGRNRQLGIAVGPLMLDYADDRLRSDIRDSFKIAVETNVALAFHIDDSMFWDRRSDLWKDPKNVEWMDWKGTVHPHRYVDWVPQTLAPQMCYNSRSIRREVGRVAREVIGAEIKRGVDALKAENREHLFAGVIAGWETHLADYSSGYAAQAPPILRLMERDRSPRVRIGYCALSNLGFSETKPPSNFQTEIAKVVHDWAEFWAKELNKAGIRKNRIYTHFSFRELYHSSSGRDWQVLNRYSRPGFTVYAMDHLNFIHSTLTKHNNPAWAVSEGSNNTYFRGDSWEVYLARIFNHGGTLANIFGWTEKDVTEYGRAANSEDAIAAYKRFLKGETLSEGSRKTPGPSAAGVPPSTIPEKMQRVRAGVEQWQNDGRDPTPVGKIMEEFDPLMTAEKFEAAEAVLDRALKFLKEKK